MRDPITTLTIDTHEINLTRRELLTLEFIGKFIGIHRVAPSMKEITEYLNTIKGYETVSSPNAIWRIANGLRSKHLLEVPNYDATAENNRTGTTHRNMIPSKLGWKVIERNKKK